LSTPLLPLGLAAVFCAATYVAASALAWRDARSGPIARRLQEVRGEAEPPVRRATLPRRAGWRLRPTEMLGGAALAAAVGGVAGFMAWHLPGGVLGAVAAGMAPRVAASRRAARRLADFNAQLPEALGILANSLRAGHAFLQAVEAVGQEMPDPIGLEFRQVIREVRVNLAVEDALGNLLSRVHSQDLDLMVTAVLIQRQVGGNLAGILDQIGETIRDRVRLQGEVRALTAQGRLSGWIVGLLPVGLGVVLGVTNPSYMAGLVDNPVGRLMVVAACVMQIVGALIIRRLVRLEV
jgi:tight adherence protein B